MISTSRAKCSVAGGCAINVGDPPVCNRAVVDRMRRPPVCHGRWSDAFSSSGRVGSARFALRWLWTSAIAPCKRVLEQHGQSQLPRPPRERCAGTRNNARANSSISISKIRQRSEMPAMTSNLRLSMTLAAKRSSRSAPMPRVSRPRRFWNRSWRLFRMQGIEAVLTDNALAFTMRHALHHERLTRFQQACAALGIRHYLLRPYAPQSNGKVGTLFPHGQ